ncbi:MAG: nucleotidyltransferase family protein, partial [Clostridia bacterium]|nr:nucleotidyltransferase family protein [Clostridia bacterium]
MTVEQLLFALLRTELCDAEIDGEVRRALADNGEALFALAKQHDLVPLITDALMKHELLDTNTSVGAMFYKEQMLAFFRHEQMVHEKERIERALADAEIVYLPLKGAVVRAFYPEPWTRTSCDIDILVHEQDLERAIRALEAIGIHARKRNYHDVSLRSESGTHLELHFTIQEAETGMDAMLAGVWDFCAPIGEGEYRYAMTPEFFLFHTVAHMAHHFMSGGCGIRPFLDIWVWRKACMPNGTVVKDMCEQGGVWSFYCAARRLIGVWLEQQPHDDLTRRMERYLLQGGAYGSIQAQAAMKQQQKGGKVRYVLSRVFLPYDMLRYYYPVLEKHKWLTPAMQVRRWGRLLRPKRLKRSVQELSANASVTKEQAAKTAELLADVGLSGNK